MQLLLLVNVPHGLYVTLGLCVRIESVAKCKLSLFSLFRRAFSRCKGFCMFGGQRFPLKSLDSSVFLAIISMQTEIARCGMDLGEVLSLVCERVQEITAA